MGDQKPAMRVGGMLRGQAWVELHGTFASKELRNLADQLDRNLKGLERKKDVVPR